MTQSTENIRSQKPNLSTIKNLTEMERGPAAERSCKVNT